MHGAIHITFGYPEIPKEPDHIAFDHLSKLPNQNDGLDALNKVRQLRHLDLLTYLTMIVTHLNTVVIEKT